MKRTALSIALFALGALVAGGVVLAQTPSESRRASSRARDISGSADRAPVARRSSGPSRDRRVMPAPPAPRATRGRRATLGRRAIRACAASGTQGRAERARDQVAGPEKPKLEPPNAEQKLLLKIAIRLKKIETALSKQRCAARRRRREAQGLRDYAVDRLYHNCVGIQSLVAEAGRTSESFAVGSASTT